jgi:cytidyltransferase-like protein
MKKRVAVFGIFDGVHAGHRDFFRQALQVASGQAKKSAELIVVVGRDVACAQWKGKKPKYSEQERLALVLKEEQVDTAVLGDIEQSTYDVVEKLAPDVICFGYDQNVLYEDIKKWLQGKEKSVELKKLNSYQPDRYHNSKL